jgi:amino acid adenylation domain-containing protein
MAVSSGLERSLLGNESRTVIGLLNAQAAITPDAVALDDGDTRWTYAELLQAAASVAAMLVGHGVGPGDAVGVCLPRSKVAIASMVGIWGAGATYVPLDPDYPTSRLGEMCDRAGVRLVIGSPELVSQVDRGMAQLDTSGIGPRAVHVDTIGLFRDPDPDSAAYILFTSGSSGRPKAVQVPHRGLTSLLGWMHSTLSREELAVTVTSTSFSFDPFILEVLGPLVVGGMVRVIPTALAISDKDDGVTMFGSTPSVVGELLRAGRLPPNIKTLIVGGETLSTSLARALLTETSIGRLINIYGPTEATVLATAHEVTLPLVGEVPIGHDLPGARVVLLDEGLAEVAVGVKGEICIFGPQVADGYVGDPESTAEQFVEWTGADGPAVRIYRTGDLGRRDEDGVIEFCGRRDRQLKLRGYRIESGEVEAMLCRHPHVTQAVVTATADDANSRLIAYVTTSATGVTPSQLRDWLKESLPRFMIPSHVMVMDSFPTTANGKLAIDRLPPWRPHHDPAASHPPVGAEGDAGAAESTVAELARQILGYEGPIHREDDILEDLGGSSLALFRLLASMEEVFSCRLPIVRILEDTSIAGLAALVGSDTDAPSSYLSVNRDGTKPPIYLIHAYLGTALRYRRLGPYLSPERPLVGILVQEFGSRTRSTRTSVDQMADEAVAQIRSLQPTGPYVLGGHSAGGLVAYETARRLVADRDQVPLVVLLDSPVIGSLAHYLWAEAILNWPDIRSATAAQRRQQLRSLIEGRLNRFRRKPGTDRVDAAITHSYRASNLAVKHYQPEPYVGDVAVLRTAQGVLMAMGKSDLGWRSLVRGRLTSFEIPGLHNTIFELPNLETVGRKLEGLLERLDEPPRRIRAWGGRPSASPRTNA